MREKMIGVLNSVFHKNGICLERSGHDFKPLQVRHCLKTRPYSKPTSLTKNKFTTEAIPFLFQTRLLLKDSINLKYKKSRVLIG